MMCFEKVTLAVMLRTVRGGQGQNRETGGYCRNTDKMVAETSALYLGFSPGHLEGWSVINRDEGRKRRSRFWRAAQKSGLGIMSLKYLLDGRCLSIETAVG